MVTVNGSAAAAPAGYSYLLAKFIKSLGISLTYTALLYKCGISRIWVCKGNKLLVIFGNRCYNKGKITAFVIIGHIFGHLFDYTVHHSIVVIHLCLYSFTVIGYIVKPVTRHIIAILVGFPAHLGIGVKTKLSVIYIKCVCCIHQITEKELCIIVVLIEIIIVIVQCFFKDGVIDVQCKRVG